MPRGNGFASFVQGLGVGQQLFQQYQAAQDRSDLTDISKAQPVQSQGYTEEDGKQLEAIANAKDADGKPAYTLTANEDGSYNVTSTADPTQTGTIQQKGVSDFLGQRTEGALSGDQVNSARQRAMAGVVMRSNPMAGAQLMNNVTQQERDTQRFGWEKSNAERAQRKGEQADADEEAVRAADSDAAGWLKKRLTNEDGSERAGGVDDHLAATQYRAMKLAEGGRLGEASQVYKDYAAQSMVKLQLEGAKRDQALSKTAAALSAGDLHAVKDFYNDFIPDGARVTEVRRDKTGQIVIERESLDGRTLPQTVMKDTGQLVSALAAFKDPMAIYGYAQNEFRNTLALRADARAGAAAGREAQAFDATAPQRQLGSTVATLQLGLGNTDDPVERQGIQDKLTAIQSGMGTGKEQPSEVKLAQALMKAGAAPDMRSALEMAITKKGKNPDEIHQEFVSAGIKNMAKPEDAVKSADDVMKAMGYSKQGGKWSAPRAEGAFSGAGATAAGVPAPDKREVGKAYDTPSGRMIWRKGGWESVDVR